MEIELEHEVRLTPIRPDDRGAYVEHFNASDVFARLLLRVPYPYTEKDADEWIAIANNTGAGQFNFAIRNPDGFLIGGCGLRDIRHGHCAELGYWVAMPYWGQGIATRAVNAVCDYGIKEWKLVRISASVFATNPASKRVLDKCGFVQEGYLRKQYFKYGEYIDAWLFARVL